MNPPYSVDSRLERANGGMIVSLKSRLEPSFQGKVRHCRVFIFAAEALALSLILKVISQCQGEMRLQSERLYYFSDFEVTKN